MVSVVAWVAVEPQPEVVLGATIRLDKPMARLHNTVVPLEVVLQLSMHRRMVLAR